VDEKGWAIWWKGVDRACLYGGIALVSVGLRFAMGEGWDIAFLGLGILFVRRPLTINLDVMVTHFDGAAAVEDDRHEASNKHVSEQEHVELLPYVPSVRSPTRDLTLV
jgi:hypothetical protein